MNVKLTLRLDDELINTAKKRARSEGKSLSGMVADYFNVLSSVAPLQTDRKLGPLSSQLCGLLKDADVSKQGYHEHLERKYK